LGFDFIGKSGVQSAGSKPCLVASVPAKRITALDQRELHDLMKGSSVESAFSRLLDEVFDVTGRIVWQELNHDLPVTRIDDTFERTVIFNRRSLVIRTGVCDI